MHRHLNHNDLTLAAIDSFIGRGKWRDWLFLAKRIRDDNIVARRVLTLTSRRLLNGRDDELDRLLYTRWNAMSSKAVNRQGQINDA